MTMTTAESEHLRQALARSKSYLEYGAGQSTVRACETTTLGEILCVESEPFFATRMVTENSILRDALNHGRLGFRFPDIGPTGAWGHPKGKSKRHLWPGYALCPYQHGFAPDLVLVDGRFRVACGLLAALELPPGTKVLVHDYRDRHYYHVLGEFFDKVSEVDTLVEFAPKENPDRIKAGLLLEKFLYLPDDQ